MPVDAYGLVYAGLVMAGGIFGYIKAGSIPSLIAGVASGLIAGYAAYIPNFYVLLGVGATLGTVMVIRFIKSGKIMPAGVIAFLSLLIIIRCIVFFGKKV